MTIINWSIGERERGTVVGLRLCVCVCVCICDGLASLIRLSWAGGRPKRKLGRFTYSLLLAFTIRTPHLHSMPASQPAS